MLKDAIGHVIESGEQYFIINGLPVHPESLEDYVIEVLGAKVVTADK